MNAIESVRGSGGAVVVVTAVVVVVVVCEVVVCEVLVCVVVVAVPVVEGELVVVDPAAASVEAAVVEGTGDVACALPDDVTGERVGAASDEALQDAPTTASATNTVGPRRRNTATASRTRVVGESLP